MKKYFFIPTLIVAAVLYSHAQMSDTLNLSYGKIFAGGKTSDRQIFLKKGSEVKKITGFKPWEEIKNILLSKDEKYLLIYHNTTQEAGWNLSILDLSLFTITKTIKPGYGGSLFWTNNNNILLIWGCGSPCACFRLYDMQFQVLLEICESCLQEFINDDLLVSLPCMVASQGIFKIYSLSDGKLLKEITFRDQYGNYYAMSAAMENNMIKTKLMCGQNLDSLVIEKIQY